MKTNRVLSFTLLTLINPCMYAMDNNLTNLRGDSTMDETLYKAIRSHKLATVQTLLERGANPIARSWYGATTLHVAYYKALWYGSDTSIAQLLIALGADPNAQDMRLNTPVHCAVRAFSKEGITQLIEAGAQVNARNARGETPLFLAVKKDAWQVIPTLIKFGGIINDTDAAGTSLLKLAIQRSLRTRKALVTSIAPQEVQHVLPAIIVLTNPCNDPGKSTLFGKNIGLLIALQLIPEILQEKLTLGSALLPRAEPQALQTRILQNIQRMITKAPRM